MLIGIVNTCGDYGLANILFVIQRVMTLFQIIVPLISNVSLITIFLTLVMNPDDSTLKARIKNWILALIIFFILPIIIDVVITNTDMVINNKSTSDYSISSCWRYAKEHSSLINTNEDEDDGYIQTEEEKNKVDIIK